jgi:hypothetical protein
VATNSTGVSVTWGGVAFTEVQGLPVVYGGGSPKGRSTEWTDELGTIVISCLGTANVSKSEYGLRKQLVISGGGLSLTEQAVYEGFSATPDLNGVTRYTVTLRLLDG